MRKRRPSVPLFFRTELLQILRISLTESPGTTLRRERSTGRIMKLIGLKRRMEDQAISLGYAGCGQAPSLNLWPGPRSHTVPPPRGQYFNDGVSHGMIHRASKARRAYGLPSLVPPEPILPLSPPPKITDPNYTDHRDMDPASMDRFLIGSPDRGMWWLNNHVDKKYQKAPQYQALVARRLASIRTPKPKPVYY